MGSRYVFNIIATVIGAFSNFLAIPVLINYFGIETFGLISQFFVVVAFVPLFELGLIQSTIQYLSSKKKESNHISPSIKAQILIIAILVLLSVLGFVIILNQPNSLFSNIEATSGTSYLIYIIFITLLIRIILPVLSIVDFVNGNINRLSLITLITNLLRNIVLVYFVLFFDLTYHYYFIGYLIMTIIELIVFIYFRVRDKKNKRTQNISPSELFSKHFLKNALKIWILIISWNGLMQYERLMLSYVLEPSEFSIVWVISSLAAAVMLVTAPLNGFTLPKLNSVNLESLKDQFESFVFTYTLLIFIPSIFVLLYQKEIFEIWLSREISFEMLLIFTFYLTGNLVHILSGFAYFIRYRFGISKRFIFITLLMTVFQAIIMYLVSNYYGALGTSFVWLVFSLISLFCLSLPKLFIVDKRFIWLKVIFIPLVLIFLLFIFTWKSFTLILVDDLYLLLLLGVTGILLFVTVTLKKSNYKIL